MTRGETTQSKIHLKGQTDDFIIFVDDVETYKKWKTDKSVPLAHFISAFKVFHNNKQGTQGTLDEAPKGSLESEFGTHVPEDVIKQILETGTLQNVEMPGRQGVKNDSMSTMKAH